MNKMHTEQTVFIIDPSLPDTLELEFLKKTLNTYGARAIYFTFDQQYGLIGSLSGIRDSMDKLSSDTKKMANYIKDIANNMNNMATDMKDMSKKLDQLENLKTMDNTLVSISKNISEMNNNISILVGLQSQQAQNRQAEQKTD
ncbi:hypothetical protein RFI_38288 [Reticulomyxa filosa]|uniref:Uncharacterized protein n=1 Tax=Reticulomyxa filosa TaxID=46433 RepID=X6LDH9_RETFI|nr:hypothetical protein RFI_38288 [Reticulomyxa filosa]|eukprot:ETN99191.1 hypothetical protein RFI_38288 [Reticulomyxa filosa]